MSTPTTGSGRIDVQFHFSPAFYTERVDEHGGHITTNRWSTEAAFEYMDAYGVAAAVMSVSTPGVDFLEPVEGVAMARALNDAAAEVARENPGRFGNFATLPMRDVAATLAEIDYCLDELAMDGVCMMSNVSGDYLGHERFAPIFDELNRRRAVVFIHPTDPVYTDRVRMAPVAEWPFDTTRAAIDLMYSGTIRRCPDVSIILAHAGGALPMVARRVEEMSFWYSGDNAMSIDETIAEVANFYYDLAISAHDNVIGALRGITSLEHVLFACDWPFAPDPAVQRNVAGFESLDLTPDERHAVERGNAARLFPKLFSQ